MDATNKIQAMRLKKKATQDEVARWLGWSRPYYAKVEGKAGRGCTIETFQKLAEVFGCTIEDIAPNAEE